MNRILLTEDNEMIREMLSFRLQRRGFDVLVADDGRQAIEIAQSSSPDLILMDLHLPVMDGWAAARALRENVATHKIPIIALTADNSDEDRASALAAGCDDYETKPVSLDRLILKMTVLLSDRIDS